jgi:hypothetical protein
MCVNIYKFCEVLFKRKKERKEKKKKEKKKKEKRKKIYDILPYLSNFVR